MQKLLVILIFLLTFNSAVAYNYSPNVLDSVKDEQKIGYNTATKEWTRTPGAKDLVFTKHITHGSGGFSEYKTKKEFFDPNSTYEFLYKNKLYGYNQHLLKFYEIKVNNGEFINVELNENQLKEFFPKTEIVKISDFKDNKIKIKKPFFKTKTFLLYNNTTRDFYKYQFEKSENPNELFRSIFEVKGPKELIFSHFGSRDSMFPILKIKVINSL